MQPPHHRWLMIDQQEKKQDIYTRSNKQQAKCKKHTADQQKIEANTKQFQGRQAGRQQQLSCTLVAVVVVVLT
jgi:hypothetical protein